MKVRQYIVTFSVNYVHKESINTSLKYLSVVLDKDGNHSLHAFLSCLPCSVLRNFELEANKFTI